MKCDATSRCWGGCKSPLALKQGVGHLTISQLFCSYICFSGKKTAGVRLARFGAACSGKEATSSSSSASSSYCIFCPNCLADPILVYRIRFKPLALCTGSCRYTFGAERRNGMRAKRFGCFREEWFRAKFLVEEGSSRGCIVHVTEMLGGARQAVAVQCINIIIIIASRCRSSLAFFLHLHCGRSRHVPTSKSSPKCCFNATRRNAQRSLPSFHFVRLPYSRSHQPQRLL